MSECGCGGLGTLGIDPETNEVLWCDCPVGRKVHLEFVIRAMNEAGALMRRAMEHASKYMSELSARLEQLIEEHDACL